MASRSLEGVEDQVEADLELVSVAVARLEDVLDSQLSEVGVRVGGQLPSDLLRDLRRLLRAVERQAGLLQREPVDVAVKQRVRMGGQLDREARFAEASEHGVMMPERRRAGGSARLHQPDRPAMP